MIDDFAALTALRNRLTMLRVVDTGDIPLVADATGYTRTSGSFVDDGFVVGMEVEPIGFANSTPGVITGLSDTRLVIDGGRTPEPVGIRSLVVGLPKLRRWENMPLTPEDRRWYIEEDYLPGSPVKITIGPRGEAEQEPVYVIRVNGLAGFGVRALYGVANAILALFPMHLPIQLSDGHVLRVRGYPGPFRGQVLPNGTSHSVITITIPLTVRTVNNL